MIEYLLDTNICIYLIKKKSATLISRLQQTEPASVGLSTIVLSELEYGVEKSQRLAQNRVALAQFVAPFEIIDYGGQAAREYGRLRSALEGQGQPIGPLDQLIAAHALALGCTLVTNNEREFERVEGLRVENWTTD